MFFVVGTGRSGTTSLASSLDNLSEFYCIHEPTPILLEESSNFRYGDLSLGDLTKKLLDTRSPLVEDKIYGESNQCISFILPAVKEAFPSAKIVWIIRNGIDFVNSAFNKNWYIPKEDVHSLANDGLKWWAKYRIQGDSLGIFSTEEWGSMSQFEKCCWYWVYTNNLIENDIKLFPDNQVYFIKLENINKDYPDLIRFLGVKKYFIQTPFKFNRTSKEEISFMNWSEAEIEAFKRICGPAMDKFYPGWLVDGKIEVPSYSQTSKFIVYRNKIFNKFFKLLG